MRICIVRGLNYDPAQLRREMGTPLPCCLPFSFPWNGKKLWLWQRARPTHKRSREKSSFVCSLWAQGTRRNFIYVYIYSYWMQILLRRHGGRLRYSGLFSLWRLWTTVRQAPQDGALPYCSQPLLGNFWKGYARNPPPWSYLVLCNRVIAVVSWRKSLFLCVTLLHGDGQNQRTNHIDVLHFNLFIFIYLFTSTLS